jgi:Tol biopolymer transport system component
MMILCACGSPGPREVRGPEKQRPAAAPRLVVSEQAGAGSHLVLVDESGHRVRELTDTPATPSADLAPVFSPDGRFVVFASSRGRKDVRLTSLWRVSVDGGEPERLTDDRGVDVSPTFAPDGKRLVFAAMRGSGNLDLFELALAPRGTPRRLAETTDAEVMPAFSPDGATLAWTAIDEARRPRIMVGDRDAGAARKLTDGNAPWFSRDGTWIAFSALASGRDDTDIFRIRLDGTDRRPIAGSPLAHETFPRFSHDGRLLFATAVVRGDDDRALLSTLVFAELVDEPEPRLRALQEPIPTSRNGLDVGPGAFDLALLRANPSYTDALRRVLVE